MKKIKIIIISMFFLIAICLLTKTTNAAYISVKPNKSSVQPGETVTLNISSDCVGRVNLTVNNGTVSNSRVWIEGGTQQVNVVVGKSGKTTITASAENGMLSNNGVDVSISNATASITINNNTTENAKPNTSVQKPTETPKTPEKSKVATLSNLGIKPNDFSGFKSNKYSYDVEVPNDVEKIEIYANKGQSAQKITGTGTKTLQEGKNTFSVVVTAEAGNTQNYTINVTRKQKQEETPVEGNPEENVDENKEETPEEEPTDKTFGLTSLKIEGLEIKPEFQTDVYEYKLELKENIDKLDITTLASEANSNIEITGNENLVEGENVITIIVKSENEEKTITYQLTVNKVIKIEQEESFMENKKIIILSVAGIVILVIVIGIVIAKLRKEKSYDSEYIPYNGLNNDYNETNEDVFESQEEQTYEEDINDDEYRKNKRSKGKRFK